MELELRAVDESVLADLEPGRHLRPGSRIAIADGAALEVIDVRRARGEAPVVVQVALTLMGNVAAGLVASWLYDRLRGCRRVEVVVDETTIELDRGEIERIVRRASHTRVER